MTIALLSDIHANQRALDACLAHAKAAGARRFAFLGDLVGYGAEPTQVLDTVMAIDDAIVLRGNHEDAALHEPARIENLEQQSAQWTHSRLAAAHRAYLADLPLSTILGDTLLVHASAHEPQRWPYLDSPPMVERCLAAAAEQYGLRRVFCGHVHEQCLYYRGRGTTTMPFAPAPGASVPVASHREWVAMVGSVGQPRDGDPRAMYALFDLAQARIVFHRVAYDHLGAAAAVRRAGLPEAFARRLEQGR